MMDIVNFRGVKATVRNTNFRFVTIAVLAFVILGLTGCPTSNSGNGTTIGPTESAATVNGKAITMEEVERAVKQQSQGQESKLSPLQLAAARLEVLRSLIEAEVMYQKAEKENAVPTDEEVTTEYNKRRNATGLSTEQFNAKMQEIGETEASAREAIKKGLAITKLTERIAAKIEPPKDGEIEAFFNSNKEGFKNKRGAQLAAIVIDPAKVAEGDTTTNEVEAQQKAKEVGERVMKGADFATVARENSEEPNTRSSGGDWRYFTEEEMKQTLGAGVADFVMNKMQNGQVVPQAIPLEGKILILKLQRKQETDEDRTLDTPGVRQEITDYLINSRKQLLGASYQAIAMYEAKIENFLAQKVISNPNELSGARPAGADTPAPANTATANGT